MTIRLLVELPDIWEPQAGREAVAWFMRNRPAAEHVDTREELATALENATVLHDSAQDVLAALKATERTDLETPEDLQPLNEDRDGTPLPPPVVPPGTPVWGTPLQPVQYPGSPTQAERDSWKARHPLPTPIPVTGPGMLVDADTLAKLAHEVSADLRLQATKAPTAAITAAASLAAAGWEILARKLLGTDREQRQPGGPVHGQFQGRT